MMAPSKDDVGSLTFYTEEFPPYNYRENGTLQGASVDLLGEITSRMGHEIAPDQVHLVPWTVGYQAALNSTKTVLFSTFRLPEREQSFKWAGPISMDRYVLFAGWDKTITINTSADLKGYRIGVVTDDAAAAQLLASGVEDGQLVCDTDVSVLIQKLARGDIDLWCYPEVVGRYLTQQVTSDYYSFRVAFALDSIDCYYAFSRDVPDPIVSSFQKALDALKQEKDARGVSTYERILGKHIPSIGLANLEYLTEEWAPFNYLQEGNASGASVEILEAVFRNLGVNRTKDAVSIVPLADAFQKAQGDNGTVVFSIVRSPAREPLYKWAGPFTKSSFVLYARLSDNISIAAPADLDKYRIGAVAATIENQLLTDKGVNTSHIVSAAVPSDLLQLLAAGQIDLWATGDLTGRYEITKAGLDPDDFGIVYTLSENDFYFIFSRDVPDALVNAFQHAIQFVRYEPDAQGVSEYERIIYRYLGVGYSSRTFTDAAVMALVNSTAAAMRANASDTLRRINAGEAPYVDPTDSGLYAFVYDTNVTVVANAVNPMVAGVNFKGKTDVTGRPFRDLIVSGALANSTGWVEYVYMNPTQTNLYHKVAYYQLVLGSDGDNYIVCSGNYKAHG
jgi:polar amino acid transport system substrate-binding protein